MITFKKRTEYHADIIAHDKIIGTLSKIANVYYELEIDYVSTVVPLSMGNKVKELIQKIYAHKLQREKRERESPFHPAKSRLHGEHEVKGTRIVEFNDEQLNNFAKFAKKQKK
jgi:hypothetical protein